MKLHKLTAVTLKALAVALSRQTHLVSNTNIAEQLRDMCLDENACMQDFSETPFLWKETLSAYASLAELTPTSDRNNQIAQGLRRLAEYDDGELNLTKPKQKPLPMAHDVSIHEIKEALWRSGHVKEHKALQGYIQERDEFLAFVAA